jgi:predicted DNA-binding transcriptional regulator AlpA
MTSETIARIRAILKADTSVTEEQAKSILRGCKRANVPRHLINAREAMAILGVTRPTLRAYVKQGRLNQINISSRKVRFDADEVRHFASNGTV